MAVFRLRLNNPLIVQGVINRLYVIQFTRYRHAFCFAGSFWIISHSNPFVKNFFRSFPNFFDWIFFPRCSREQLGHLSTDDFICQELFYIFFQISSSFPGRPRSRGQPAYIITYVFICQGLFYKMRQLFCALTQQRKGPLFKAPSRYFDYSVSSSRP